MLNNESNINDKINLKKNIKFLNNKEDYLVILQFLIDNKIKYTENSNGIFFNLKLWESGKNSKSYRKMKNIIFSP